ncbi:MAG: FecR domain-containing protein [Clostridium sp.]|nr:FecR domain-containing protein [Clostridium sp.]
MKRKWSKILVLAVMAACLSANPCSFADDTESRTLSILEVSGSEAYVKKNAPGRFAAVAGLNLGEGNQVSTGKASSIYIKADDDKTMKLDNNTSVDVEKASAKSLKLTLKKGKLFFNVEKPLGEDEELQFKAGQTSMSIRGTSGVIKYHPDVLCYYLIEGTVSVELGNDQRLELHAGQKAELVRDWGDDTPGPGSEAGYVLKESGAFHWTELDTTILKTVLENREHLDLGAIGLNSREEQEWAEALLEEQERLKQTVKKPSHTHNGGGGRGHSSRDDVKPEPLPPEEEVVPPETENPPEEVVVPPEAENPPEEVVVPPDEENSTGEEVVPPDEENSTGEEGLPDKENPADEDAGGNADTAGNENTGGNEDAASDGEVTQ